MNRIGIKIDLDTGDLVSSAGRARQSIASLTDEMKKAQKEGRYVDASNIKYERDRLRGKTSAFERDTQALANDPRFQTQTTTGGTVLKIDPEYADAIKSQTEAIKRLTDEYQGAIRNGNVGKIRELTPQIEKQQGELHKTVKDIINTDGDFPKKIPPDNYAPDDRTKPRAPLLSDNGDWRELKGLSGAITQEHDAGDWGQVARLGNTKDTLQGIMGQYDRDSKLEANLKADPEFSSQLKEIRDALKGTIAAINDAAANGDYEKADQLTGQAKQLQGISHKTVEAAMAPPQSQADKGALSSFLNVQTAQQIVGAVTNGINTYVAHLDRSGIVNAMGSGDPMGAQIEEMHRSAKEKGNLWESVGRIGGGILGGVAGTFIGGPVVGTAAGAAIGSTLLGAGGSLIGTLGDEKKANEMATSEAYAKLWERQAPDAMNLTATLGKYGGTREENTGSIRRTWENAANTATEYGFSPEEGVEQVKQAASQGLSERQALDAARDVFAFERGTGADRGVLSEFRNRTERFGIADGLNTAWQGNQASGMDQGQFNEFLRSMQKTFEDGISKGFIRGADEIAGNFAFLSDLNGGSELWKGDLGANRLSQMNAGLETTTGLSSASDILSFRGAQNLLKQWDAEGTPEGAAESTADKNWKAIGDLDPKKEGNELRRGYDYIDAMAILERGLTPELFHSQMQMIEGVEGPGNRTGAVEQMKNIYGLNYTGSAALYQTYQDKVAEFGGDKEAADTYFKGDEWGKTLEDFKANPDYNSSSELSMFRDVEEIKKYTVQIGQWHLDKKLPEIAEALKTAWKDANEKGTTRDSKAGVHPYPAEPTATKPESETPIHTRVDESLENLKNVASNPVSTGDQILSARNAAIDAQIEAGMISYTAKNATRNLFSENAGDESNIFKQVGNFFTGKNEKKEFSAINDTVISAIDSGDPAQFDAAKEFSELLSRYGNDKKTGDPYNKDNTFNSLADFSGDMSGMLTALRGLIEKIDGVKVEVSTEN
jgi:hypothetical protein